MCACAQQRLHLFHFLSLSPSLPSHHSMVSGCRDRNNMLITSATSAGLHRGSPQLTLPLAASPLPSVMLSPSVSPSVFALSHSSLSLCLHLTVSIFHNVFHLIFLSLSLSYCPFILRSISLLYFCMPACLCVCLHLILFECMPVGLSLCLCFSPYCLFIIFLCLPLFVARPFI